MTGNLLKDAWRLAWPLTIAGLLSTHYQTLWPLCTLLAVFLSWQVWQKWRLARWLERGNLLDPPHASGLWERFYTRLMHLFRAEQKTQQQLAHVLDRIRRSADTFDEALLLLAPDLRVAYYNHAAGKLLGLLPIDQGELLTNLLRAPEMHHYLEQADFDEPLVLSAAWEGMILRFNVTPLSQEGFLLRIADITHIHKLETLRRDFVANVSHELKTPITVFKGSLELLQDRAHDLEPAYQMLLNHMQQQSERMEGLIEHLLLLAKLENHVIPAKEPFSLTELCEKIKRTLHEKTREKHHEMQWEIQPGLFLQGIPDEIESALGNLVDNALNYTPPGGYIQISCQQQGTQIVFCVQDNGPGIEPQHLPHLTERFYRVDKNRERITGGTGLGLAIVKHALQRHGSQLEVTSQPGQGSRFSCRFEAIQEK